MARQRAALICCLLSTSASEAFVMQPVNSYHRGSCLKMQASQDGASSSSALTRGGTSRRSFAANVLTSLSMLSLVAVQPASARFTNIEEAREKGDRIREEIEKAKGPLIVLDQGVKYREELVGRGPELEKGDLVKIRYEVLKGNGDYMWSYGIGKDIGQGGRQDLGETYDFIFGRPNSVPKAVEIGMEGMVQGGKRKIAVPPQLGFDTSGGFPEPETVSGRRKLAAHRREQLLFDVELVKVKKRNQRAAADKAI